MEAQCWICPTCNYDHAQTDVCYRAELLTVNRLLMIERSKTKFLLQAIYDTRRPIDEALGRMGQFNSIYADLAPSGAEI